MTTNDRQNGHKRRGTRTSAFGTAGRVSHDASSYYARRLHDGLPQEERVDYVEHALPDTAIDRILHKSAQEMSELPDKSVHLMVTSPPYNVGKDYDADLSLGEYRAFLKDVWAETYRALVPGGRACVNVANLGRRPYLPLHAFIIADMLEAGFLMRGEVLWDKGPSPSTAWGTWQSAGNPTLRDTHEYVLIFSKQSFSRPKVEGRRSTISRDDFLEFTKSVWRFTGESASRVGHPAPFPVELPARLIQLYTYEGEVVLDPFMGSGSTALAALQAGRRYVGYETDAAYVELAEGRIAKARMGLERERAKAGDGSELDPVKQRTVDAVGHDPHLNPPPLKGEEIPQARKGNGEA